MKRNQPFRFLAAALLAVGFSLSTKDARGQDDDPFTVGPPPGGADRVAHEPEITQVGILIEWVELDARTANKLVRKHLTQTGPAALPNAFRNEVEKLIDDEEAKLIGTDFVVTRSGQRAKVESIEEKIYATEYEPPELPSSLTLVGASIKPSGATPTAFDMRPVGSTMEVDPVIGASGQLIDLNIAPEQTEFVGRDYVSNEDSPNEETGDIWMPRFFTMRVSTAVALRDGESQLVSIQRPRTEEKLVLVFVQGNVLH